MDPDLDQLIEDYLDGTLSLKETNWFERKLVRPGIQVAFAEALALRELLKTAGPNGPPAGLEERIENAILADQSKQKQRGGWLGATRTALSGMAWAFRGPALALSSQPTGTRETLSGMGTIRYTLGPLARTTSTNVQDEPRRRSGWWKRVLRLGR